MSNFDDLIDEFELSDPEMMEQARKEAKEWSTFKDKYRCDCDTNYGKDCKYPDKYKDGGCK